MRIEEAATQIQKEVESIEGIEINFDDDGAEIYWEQLRVTCTPKDLPKALKAIRELHALGAHFS